MLVLLAADADAWSSHLRGFLGSALEIRINACELVRFPLSDLGKLGNLRRGYSMNTVGDYVWSSYLMT